MAKKTAKEVASAIGIDDYKPTITLDKKIYPDLDKLKVDEIVDLTIKVKINNISRSQYGDKALHVSGTIENAESESSDSEDY